MKVIFTSHIFPLSRHFVLVIFIRDIVEKMTSFVILCGVEKTGWRGSRVAKKIRSDAYDVKVLLVSCYFMPNRIPKTRWPFDNFQRFSCNETPAGTTADYDCLFYFKRHA